MDSEKKKRRNNVTTPEQRILYILMNHIVNIDLPGIALFKYIYIYI